MPSSIPCPIPRAKPLRPLPGDASWTALLAGVEWGLETVGHRVVVQRAASPQAPQGSLRLVVQSYPAKDLYGCWPRSNARPIACATRLVNAVELERGVELKLMHFERDLAPIAVVAWTEPGDPELELEGLQARPSQDACLAAVRHVARRQTRLSA